MKLSQLTKKQKQAIRNMAGEPNADIAIIGGSEAAPFCPANDGYTVYVGEHFGLGHLDQPKKT